MKVSERAQHLSIWCTLIMMFTFGWVLWGLLYMLPPPMATLSEVEVAAFYRANAFDIRLGAMIASWISAFGVPFAVVIAIQLARLEKQDSPEGAPVWSLLAFAGGILMTMFLVFPPIVWGTAAFTAERAPQLTTILHELGTLTLVTTDQFFIFQMIPIAIVSLRVKHDEYSAFPRWLGYFTLWAALVFEVGALAFMFKSGPFSWNGIMVFWAPLIVYGSWVTVTCVVILKALARQAGMSSAA
ncbi:MAG: hypothetical protein RID07_20265 [Lacipirellulaceae bacterium]|uniref:hypothetical protein n=1 Tax=Marinobacter salarius TaxID=1420917 RepID=UPI0032EF7EBC